LDNIINMQYDISQTCSGDIGVARSYRQDSPKGQLKFLTNEKTHNMYMILLFHINTIGHLCEVA